MPLTQHAATQTAQQANKQTKACSRSYKQVVYISHTGELLEALDHLLGVLSV
jgi:hypothetical protein